MTPRMTPRTLRASFEGGHTLTPLHEGDTMSGKVNSAALMALEAESRRESLAPPYVPPPSMNKNKRFVPLMSTVISTSDNLQDLGGMEGHQDMAVRGGEMRFDAIRESDKSDDGYVHNFVDMTTDMQGG